jgi:uncharacterized protein (TIGR02453 family)
MSAAPKFSGFPKAALQFFSDITTNNNREWFEAHKKDYLERVVAPAQSFVLELGAKLQAALPDIVYDARANGSGSIGRIYRDIRFSRDKSPYKDYLGIVFWQQGQKKNDGAGFYFHLNASGAEIYTGMYAFDKPFMEAYRDALVSKKLGAAFDDVLAALKKAGDYPVGGELFKRTPAGYDAAHPHANFLRYNGIYAQSPHLDAEILASPQLIDVCFDHCVNMAPLHHWLVAVEERTVRD